MFVYKTNNPTIMHPRNIYLNKPPNFIELRNEFEEFAAKAEVVSLLLIL